MRSIGLVDSGYPSQYQTYRVPDPEAPYPQDYIIDKQGRVHYWEGEYDPQKCTDVIEDLLAYVPPVTVTAVPDSTQIQPGGTLGYTVTLVNNTGTVQTIVARVDAILTDGNRMVLEGPRPVQMNAGGVINVHMTRLVPGYAQSGSYSLKVKVATSSGDVLDVDGFGFVIN